MSTIQHCETCAHWKRREPPDDFSGTCHSIHFDDIEQCASPISCTYSYHEGGQFITGQHFGCVHHVRKTVFIGGVEVRAE